MSEIEKLKQENAELRARLVQCVEAAKAAIEWIDAVPPDTKLPAMPGFDRDWFDSAVDLKQAILDAEVLRCVYRLYALHEKDPNSGQAANDLVQEHCRAVSELYAAVRAAKEGEDMAVHELKTDPAVFQEVVEGRKKFEIRKNDRGFQVGDELWLKETRFSSKEMEPRLYGAYPGEITEGKPLEYTGRIIIKTVTHILHGPKYGLLAGWCIMSIE